MAREGESKKRDSTSPNNKHKLDPFAILVVAKLHPHVRVRSLVVCERRAHLGYRAAARGGQRQVVRRRGRILALVLAQKNTTCAYC
jgi:hypothetical protein